MASLSQCPNGHFFDRDIYSSCPYCDGKSQKVDRVGGYDGTYTVPLSGPASGTSGASSGIPTAPVDTISQGNSRDTVPPPKSDITIPVNFFGDEKSDGGTKFVVGWLAAIEGPYKGKSFELHSGYNRVGRKEGDIRLEKDNTISRSNHFRIVYDAEDNNFLFFAGESDNYPRVNDEKKYAGERAELKPYSEIKAGESKFLFVPLCSDLFKWF